ncbi:hypothetical protein [Basfia succiniciproducens]|uniref:hypothetical protein n=1 Tax=Basfia succiniciproducens TaxID=653940 RepID=UPI0008B61A38|nr:hypothetical protein [Basfia succiniciproducens]SEQ65136.1 hypothetical protein SAMN02910415_01827 [Basfia succiniciproducens]
MIKEPLKEIVTLIVLAAVMLLIGAILEKAFAATPQETCEIKGGVWIGEYCAPLDMTDDEIAYAERYTALKQAEMKGLINAGK